MSKENKVPIYNKLFFKLYLNYAIMLLVTAILICFIFIRLYENTTMTNNRVQVQEQAENIASMITDEFISNEKYREYLDINNKLTEIMGLDFWTIANPSAKYPMDERLTTISNEELAELADYEDYIYLVDRAFNNEPEYSYNYDEIYQAQTITMAVPIYGLNRDEVVGAVLLKSPVTELKDILNGSLRVIIYSSVAALAISFIIIIVFTTELALPISRMRITALELAAGNYNSKTGISRKDEIGDLAKTVDILSEKLMENDIQRKNLDQMRLDFFANVSHELRTPITVLRAYTETLVDGVVQEKEKVEQYYDRMLSECKTMERLVGDLLLLSKMQNPDFAIEKEPVNLVQIFDDIIRSAGTIAEKKNISIEVVKDSPVLMMHGDYDRLRQMFMVILDNAIKFSNENKTVHINLSKKDNIIVSIRDEGIGIEPSDITNIFEKFYKTNLRQNASGTGLGLAIAKQIAIKHEGNIEVSSTPGVGSTFVFTFPIEDQNF